MKRIYALLSLMLVASVLLSGCQPAQQSTTFKIGLLGPLTGDVATFGASNRDGAILAFEEWNAKGGVLGKKIEWILGDTQCDPKAAADAGKKVIDEDKVKFIVGAVCSSASIPIAQYANEKKVLQISGTSTNPLVTVGEDGKVKPYTFRACFDDPFQGSAIAAIALNQLQAKTAAVVYDSGNDYIKGLAEYFKAAFEAKGGKILVWEAFVKEDTDFSAILSKVKDANPDVFVVPTYYDKMNLIGAQAKQKGITAPMIGGDGWDSADLDTAAADGGYFTNHYAPSDPRPIVQNFVKSYQAKHNVVPDALAALAYDASIILLESIKKAGTDDPVKVKDVMATISVEGVSGMISFDANHNPVKKAAILHVTNGKVEFFDWATP